MTTPDASGGARDGPEVPLTHMSYSGLTNYLKCGKSYQLTRILKIPEQPAFWNIGGRAVHEATEVLDRKRFEQSGD